MPTIVVRGPTFIQPILNQSNLKSFQKVLIGWKKAGPTKKATLIVLL